MSAKEEQYVEVYQKDQVVCLEGQQLTDLYIIKKGTLLICVRRDSSVYPLAYLGAGEYLGELSFFDDTPRSADVIALEETILIKIPQSSREEFFPRWLKTLAINMAKHIRKADEIIKKNGIKKQKTQSVKIKPFTIEEQTYYYNLLKNHTKTPS